MGQSFQDKKAPFDIDALLHPSNAFRHPLDIVRDPDMTVAEKRAVLASWASDACAIESNPALRTATTGNDHHRCATIGRRAVVGDAGLHLQAPPAAQAVDQVERARRPVRQR
jgi:hypothetical protein